jgi:uncharacterized phage protein (TIGR01671 family)
MREIKFRAYSNQRKKMYSSAIPTLSGGIEWEYEHGTRGFDSLGENYILMQFTGLKDKNGKEIFEGDILSIEEPKIEGKQTRLGRYVVKFGEWSCECGDYYCSEHGIGWYVEGFQGYHRISGEDDIWKCLETLESNSGEVIGNVHEHSSLLDK